MNVQLAFRIVNVCAIALAVVNRTLIIIENSQKEKNVRDKSKLTESSIHSDSGD